MPVYTLYVLYHHQSNILFLLFAHNFQILLRVFFYNKTRQHSPATVTYLFTRLCELPITYFYVFGYCYQTIEDGLVLGYHIHDFQHKIPLSKY